MERLATRKTLNAALADGSAGEKLKAEFGGWKPDGSAFYVRSNERDPKAFDLYRYDSKTYARTMVFKNEKNFELGPVSRDGKWVALDKPNTTLDSDIHLYDVAKGETRHITLDFAREQR